MKGFLIWLGAMLAILALFFWGLPLAVNGPVREAVIELKVGTTNVSGSQGNPLIKDSGELEYRVAGTIKTENPGFSDGEAFIMVKKIPKVLYDRLKRGDVVKLRVTYRSRGDYGDFDWKETVE